MSTSLATARGRFSRGQSLAVGADEYAQSLAYRNQIPSSTEYMARCLLYVRVRASFQGMPPSRVFKAWVRRELPRAREDAMISMREASQPNASLAIKAHSRGRVGYFDLIKKLISSIEMGVERLYSYVYSDVRRHAFV